MVYQHGAIITRKAAIANIAKIEAEIAAKSKSVTVDICGEISVVSTCDRGWGRRHT